MDSKTFQTKLGHTFTKNTNRKYFGAPDGGDMKKSSILFDHGQHSDDFGTSYKSNAQTGLDLQTTEADPPISNRTKSQTMYASMIVGKSDTYSSPSGLASSNVKELNDKADQLKKRLLQMAAKKSDKDDLVKKYSQPVSSSASSSYDTSSSPFSKASKNAETYTTPGGTDYSKLNAFVKQVKKQYDAPSYDSKSYSTSSSSNYETNSYAPSNNQYSNNLPTNPFKKSATSTYPDYTSYSTPSSYSSYPPVNVSQEPKKMKKEDFEIGKKLGNGMFGQVFLVRHKVLRFVCAMKILKKQVVRTQKVEDQLVREIKIQFYLKHQNIINLYGFFSDSECVYLLQEICMDGHLFNMLKVKQRFEEPEAADIIRQVCKGLDYIHRERIIHRDIKPENIIMHQGVAKICDFGWAVYRGEGLRGTYCGTPLYTPPELLRGEKYDQKFDIWAIGILAYELIVGRFPFKIFCEDDINRILTDEITFPFSVDISPDAKNFILSIIRKDPRDRIQIDEILNHQFLRNNNLKTIQIDFKI